MLFATDPNSSVLDVGRALIKLFFALLLTIFEVALARSAMLVQAQFAATAEAIVATAKETIATSNIDKSKLEVTSSIYV